MHRILIINPGSTSTKIALYEDEKEIFRASIEHSADELKPFKTIWDQLELRRAVVLDFLERNGVAVGDLDCIMCRGGMLPPVSAGAYVVDADLLEVQRNRPSGLHVSNLACAIGHMLAAPTGIPVYIYDPVSVDELIPEAQMTGVKDVRRVCFSHLLNMRAIAQKAAAGMGGNYADYNFVIAHLGGGCSVSAHRKGRMIDNFMDDEGPFSPERCGALQGQTVIALCESMGADACRRLFRGGGGFVSYFGTSDAREVEQRIEAGSREAEQVFEAMAYQMAKCVGAQAAALSGQVDRILITGGLAHSKRLLDRITARVEFIAPVEVYPGENEMEALAFGALRVLRGEERTYTLEEGMTRLTTKL